MVVCNSNQEIGRIKNRTFARIGKVMNAVVVAFAACRQMDGSSHLVSRDIDRIVQVVDAAANLDGIARGHDLVCLVERGEGLVLRTCRIIVAIGRHVIHGTERLHCREGKRKRESEPFVHKHLEYMLLYILYFLEKRYPF